MNTATTQKPAESLSLDTAAPVSQDQNTLDVVQKLQSKLRNTRQNLERLRIDPANESGPVKPHLITETIANQLRLVNQERIDLMQQLGVEGGEKLRDVVGRMQQEISQLRSQNSELKSSPPPMQEGSPQAKTRPPAANESLLNNALDTLGNEKPATPPARQRDENRMPRPKTVIEQQRRQQAEQASQAEAAPPHTQEAPSADPKLTELLEMLQSHDLEEAQQKIQELKEQGEQFPRQKEALLLKNKELSTAVKRMHADQMALCKRFNVSSMSEMARLIMETMNIKKAQADAAPLSEKEINSWTAVSDLLQDWDHKINVTDPNHSVKVERTGGSWALSANWNENEKRT